MKFAVRTKVEAENGCGCTDDAVFDADHHDSDAVTGIEDALSAANASIFLCKRAGHILWYSTHRNRACEPTSFS